jgi:uncharacterized protein (DUF2147 family)
MRKLSYSVLLILLVGPATASPLGTWRMTTGSAVAQIRLCGRNLCGSINGNPVMNSMRVAGKNSWAGSISDTGTGSVFYGTVTQTGEDVLQVHGCFRESGACGDQTWTRVK